MKRIGFSKRRSERGIDTEIGPGVGHTNGGRDHGRCGWYCRVPGSMLCAHEKTAGMPTQRHGKEGSLSLVGLVWFGL